MTLFLCMYLGLSTFLIHEWTSTRFNKPKNVGDLFYKKKSLKVKNE